jgi:succinyl-diaminopimelate desuccinylase
VVELGPLNATIHQVDECVSVQDLEIRRIINIAVLVI